MTTNILMRTSIKSRDPRGGGFVGMPAERVYTCESGSLLIFKEFIYSEWHDGSFTLFLADVVAIDHHAASEGHFGNIILYVSSGMVTLGSFDNQIVSDVAHLLRRLTIMRKFRTNITI